jgi:putative tryptophan/tyrosine transport system substrate-binding protein
MEPETRTEKLLRKYFFDRLFSAWLITRGFCAAAVLAFCSLLLAPCSATQAQQTGKIFRIGFLDNSTASGIAVLSEAFRQELTKLGWINGKNIAIEYRFGENKGTGRVPELAADLVRLKVDLIVGASMQSALAAKSATTTIPIVMTSNPDPVAAGLVASLARPGGNVTGPSGLAIELNTKRLEVLKDAVLKLSRVGLLRTAGGSDRQLKDLRPAALALKLKLEEIETEPNTKGLESAFQAAKQKQVGAIMTTVSRSFFHREEADRRACHPTPLAGYLPREGVCRGGRSDVLWTGLP